jgi:hypothetical protein
LRKKIRYLIDLFIGQVGKIEILKNQTEKKIIKKRKLGRGSFLTN